MTGQVCSSLTRIVVPRNRHDEFVDALASAFSQVQVGDPFDATTQMGPLAMERQRDRVEGYIAKGVEEGCDPRHRRWHRPKHLKRGYFIEPTVFGNVDNSSTIAQEEIFGPVLSVIPADNEEHAVEIANDTIYGLNASVFTNGRRPGPRGGRPAALGHRRPQQLFVPTSVSRSGASSSPVWAAKAASKACSPSWKPRRFILDDARTDFTSVRRRERGR
jgi:hypothetical protein